MQRHACQQGIGLIEVMVAVTLLSIAVLGYGALQLRAMNASQQAMQNIQAMNLARDLAERMRINRAGFGFYQTYAQQDSSNSFASSSHKACAAAMDETMQQAGEFCSAQQMAQYDIQQVKQKAAALAMRVAILDCPNIQLKRQCIYVAWGETEPNDGDKAKDCTQGAAYRMRSNCIFMEAFNSEGV